MFNPVAPSALMLDVQRNYADLPPVQVTCPRIVGRFIHPAYVEAFINSLLNG